MSDPSAETVYLRSIEAKLAEAEATLREMRRLPLSGAPPWRVGRKVGRTLYDADDRLIGVMDTPALAEKVVRAIAVTTWSYDDVSAYEPEESR